MEPTNKAPGIEAAIDKLLGPGPGRRDSIKSGICAVCKRPATRFTDTLSKREYAISGLCQECQDGFFEDDQERERAEDAADKAQGRIG